MEAGWVMLAGVIVIPLACVMAMAALVLLLRGIGALVELILGS